MKSREMTCKIVMCRKCILLRVVAYFATIHAEMSCLIFCDNSFYYKSIIKALEMSS